MTRRVLLLGGTGVFGSRIARLLAGTLDAEFILAGRDPARASALAAQLRSLGAGARPLVLERERGRLAAVLGDERPALLIDASGPFQAYGHDIPLLCIARGIPYLDIADDRAFVTGIRALDPAARRASVPVLSGASSVPCLSGAAAEELAEGLDMVESVRSWISPGNRAPRGRSVVRAVLAGVGRPLRWRQDGAWRTVHGWQDLRRVQVPGLGRRWLSACDVPDLELLPERWPGLREATFHAGLELAPLHLGLWTLSWAPRLGLLRGLAPLAPVVTAMARALEAFGTDRGGMRVEVEGLLSGRRVRRSWTLVAGSGHGPWVPAAPAAALARRLLSGDPPPAGARPCLGALSLAPALAELRHLDIATYVEQSDG